MHTPLLIVDLVLKHQQDAAALQDLGPTIADFLGPDRYLSLHQACRFGSLKLLDWIWRISSSSNRSNWSLTSYLHCNRHYYQWQFSESLEIAAGRGDVKIVKWLFDHFQNCQVAVEVVTTAARSGHLKVLQFLLEHDQEKIKGDINFSTHKVHWGGSSLVCAVGNGHLDVVQWLCRYNAHECDELQIAIAIKTALLMGDMKIVEILLPGGKCMLDYAESCPHQDVIEWKLDCGYFQHDPFSAGVAIKDLVISERLDLMQRLAEQYDPPPCSSGWSTNWRCAMVHACVYGRRDILQWLMEHPAGRWTVDGDDRLFSELVFSAAYSGSIDVMEFLYERGAIDTVRDALMHAVRENHFDMVKWLIEHFPASERIPDYCLMDEAARYGRLEILKYFEGLDGRAVSGYFPLEMPPTQRRTRGDSFVNQMFVPSSDDYRKVHPTMCRYRSEWHPTDPMDDAAANGHLEVVKWLHFNRSEGCTIAAMDCAAANGHLDVVKWLHTHRSEGCTTKAMDGAATKGHLDVIQWLYSFRFERCTVNAIEGALNYGHLRVAAWLHAHLPSLDPANVELWRNLPALFDLLLFQRFHFNNSFKPRIMGYTHDVMMYKSNHRHILTWLQEEFPTALDILEEEQW